MYDKRHPEEYWEMIVALMVSFAKKHQEIEKVRDITRLRKIPDKVLETKYIITARNALGWAIAQQMRSFFDPAPRKVEVSTRRAMKKKDKDVTKQLGWWLLGSSDELNREASDPESGFIWNGIESGSGIIGAAFDPFRAKAGKFGIEVMVPDPGVCAYQRSAYGLTDFVSQELRTVAMVKDELETYAKRSGGKVMLPDSIVDGNPTDAIEDTRYFDKCYEVRFIDGSHVYTRKHLLSRVPMDIADWYNMPSDRPEEWSMGVISPIRDLLEAYQQIIDIVATDMELAQRPLGILFDGGKYEIVQIGPGEGFPVTNPQTASLVPVEYKSNYQTLHELAGIIGDQIDVAALPRNTFSGPQFKLSGFAVEKYIQGIQSRIDFLKRAPERAFGFHYKLRLEIVRQFATKEVAKVLGCKGDEIEDYLSSFNVQGFGAKVEGTQPERIWLAISADEIPEQVEVKVDISPNVPSDETGRIARTKESLGMGMGWEWTMRYVHKAENLDTLLAEHDVDMLVATDDVFKMFYMDYKKDQVFKRDKEMAKAFEQWKIANGMAEDPNAANTIDGETVNPALGAGEDLNFVTDEELMQQQMMGAQGQGQPGGMPPPQLMPPQGAPPPMGGAPMPQLGAGGQNPMQAIAAAMGLA